MRIIQILKGYSVRLLKLWIIWFWFFALDALGLVVDTFIPDFSPPRWLYWAVAVLGFLTANVRMFAESESEKYLLRERIAQLEEPYADLFARVRSKFQEIVRIMPKLLAEMKEDLANDETQLVREFITLSNKHVAFNSLKPRFVYYEDAHPFLRSKIDRLEDCGFVVRIGIEGIYRMTDEFIKLLNETDLTVQ